MKLPIIFVLLSLASIVHGQFLPPPESAKSSMSFTQIATGGGIQTTITLANPNRYPVFGEIQFHKSDGTPFDLDFGNGSSSTLTFSLPPFDSQAFTTTSGGRDVQTGWGKLFASSTIQGVATYGLSEGIAEVSVPGSSPSIEHVFPATSKTALAVGNLFSDVPLDIQVEALESDRSFVTNITLPANGHRAFFLDEILTDIPDSFKGIVILLSHPESFPALALRSNGQAFSSLPGGAVARPKDYFDLIWDIFLRIHNELYHLDEFISITPRMPNIDNIQLEIGREKVINAFAGAEGIEINLALAELISDSESELAFVIGHEIGHVYQFRTGVYQFHPPNRELDADVWGLVLALMAGYDPYGSAGALAKMTMALGAADLQSQGNWQLQYLIEFLLVEGQTGVSHGSFNERLDHLYGTIETACNWDTFREFCGAYKDRFHPHLPGSLLVAPSVEDD